MRQFSNSEKKIIDKLTEKSQFFSDLFEKDFLQDLLIKIKTDRFNNEYSIDLIIKNPNKDQKEEDDYITKKMSEATERIVNTINIIKYLEQNAYLYSYLPAHGRRAESYIGLNEVYNEYKRNPENFVNTPYPDLDTQDLIHEYINLLFVSSEALQIYKIKGYKTPEEIRHKQILFVAWIAIGISIIIGITSIIINLNS